MTPPEDDRLLLWAAIRGAASPRERGRAKRLERRGALTPSQRAWALDVAKKAIVPRVAAGARSATEADAKPSILHGVIFEIMRVAVHEAGHVVMARALGQSVTAATIVATPTTGGRALIRFDDDGPVAALIALAGLAAEELAIEIPRDGLFASAAREAIAPISGGMPMSDRDDEVRACHLLLGVGVAPKALERGLAIYFDGAIAMLRACRPATEDLAAALMRRRTLARDDIEQITDRHDLASAIRPVAERLGFARAHQIYRRSLWKAKAA